MNDPRHLDIPYLTALREELLRAAARLRELLANGDAQIVATTTIDGQDVLKIVAHSSNDMLFNGTIYVDTKSYRPVLAEIQQNAYDCGHSSPCSGLERIRFLAYE